MKPAKLAVLAAALLTATPALRAEVVASVGGDKIESAEFEAKVSIEERNAGRKLSEDERKAVLVSLVNQRLLVAKAKDMGVNKRDEFKMALADYERQLLANSVYDDAVASKAQVSEAEGKSFFEANPRLFDVRQVSQILVQPLSQDKVQAASKAAERLKAKVSASPKSFAETAKAESDDMASKERGGDLGTLRPGMMLPELEKAVWAAKAGSIVGPVQTRFGFHVLYVRSSHKQSWDEAKEVVVKELTRAKAAELQQKLLDELAKQYKVKINGTK